MSCIKKNYTIQVKANCCLRVIDGASVIFQMAQRACSPETANERREEWALFNPVMLIIALRAMSLWNFVESVLLQLCSKHEHIEWCVERSRCGGRYLSHLHSAYSSFKLTLRCKISGTCQSLKCLIFFTFCDMMTQ